MSRSLTESRPFEPGTTGWTASDLDDPAIERLWFEGRYEIVEGILTQMAPAYFVGGEVLYRLMYFVTSHIGLKAGSFSIEVDIVIDEDRVVRSDAAFLTPEQKELQRQAALAAGRTDVLRTRILIPPSIVIECISPGHERYDEHTKRRWYAEFGVANYWILDPFKQTLKCLILRNGVYNDDASGQANDEVRPSLFPGLVLRLREIWDA
jgi:Uma2 family endonuclease